MKVATAYLILSVSLVTGARGQGHDVSGDTGAILPAESATQLQGSLDQRLGELSQQIANKIEAGQKQKIAVLEFTDLQGSVTDFGRYLAEELITRLYQTDKFKVIERQLLNKVIAEQKLSLTGVVDQASAKQLGKLLGVDAIVSGTIASLSQSLKVNARLISTETGEIFSVASTEIFKDESVKGLMSGNPNPSPSRRSQSTTDDSSKTKKKVVSDDFTFELNACRRTGQSVLCDFTIVNNSSEDRLFYLFGDNNRNSRTSSRLIDNTGREYYPSETRLGGATADSRRLWLSLSLVPQVSIRASLRFESVNADAASIELLRITFNRAGKRRSSLREPQADYADFSGVAIE
jgi:TolB-like protein